MLVHPFLGVTTSDSINASIQTPSKFQETTRKYVKLPVVCQHNSDNTKFLKEKGTEHIALPASSPSKSSGAVCSRGPEKNLCSFNSFQWRTVVYNRRNLMAAFHLASYLFTHVGSTQLYVRQALCEPTIASPVLDPTRVSSQPHSLLKTDLEL